MRFSTLTALSLLLLCFSLTPLRAQVIPEPVEDRAIYLFLSELAGDGIIVLNQAVKPYSRRLIAEKLEEADTRRDMLTRRQLGELDFWLGNYSNGVYKPGVDSPVLNSPGADSPGADNPGVDSSGGEKERMKERMKLIFNPATAQYRDSLFSVTISPVLGFSGGITNREARETSVSWKNGAKVYGSYGNLAFFASLRDNHQDPLTGAPEYLTPERGGHIKNMTDFSEMTGGVSYMWRWGDISFLKDSPVWGSGYAGTNILSGRAPSFMQLRLHLKPVEWAEMTWLFGWLTSMVVDSTRSYWVTNAYGTGYREIYHKKYIAANLFTFTPVPRLHISVGNSVIWSDPRITPYYLMPIFFYKSVDHGVNSGIGNSNSQMFIDISSNNIRHLYLYGTLFIDELSTARFTTSDYNFFSWKGGVRAGNFGFMPDIWLTAECTFTYPLTFQHNVPVTTFENQGYNLGHWLRDNSRSWYLALDYKPVRAMTLRLWHESSERGPDYQSIGGSRVGLPYMETIEWSNVATGFEASYLITGGVEVRAAVTRRNVEGREDWYPAYLYGKTTTFSGGVIWGF